MLLHAGSRSGVEKEESQSSLLSIWKFKPARKKCTLNRQQKHRQSKVNGGQIEANMEEPAKGGINLQLHRLVKQLDKAG